MGHTFEHAMAKSLGKIQVFATTEFNFIVNFDSKNCHNEIRRNRKQNDCFSTVVQHFKKRKIEAVSQVPNILLDAIEFTANKRIA